jgi:hypothetical protein
MKSILDPSFRYVKSVDTDLRKTFARIYRDQRKREQQAQHPASPADVLSIRPQPASSLRRKVG